MAYKIGDKSETGQEIASILGQSKRASVFTTTDNNLRWEFYDNEEVVPDWLLPCISEFDNLIVQIKLTLTNKSRKETFIRLGKALYASLVTTSEDQLQDHFDSIKEYIKAKANEKARLFYVLTGLVIFMVFAIVGSLIYSNIQESWPVISGVLFGSLFGSLGSLLSVLLRNNELQVDPFSSVSFISFQSLFRIVTGFFAGLLLVIAIKAELILGSMSDNLYVIAVASIASGFSERFIPEFVKEFEKKIRESNS